MGVKCDDNFRKKYGFTGGFERMRSADLHGARKSSPIHKDDKKAGIEQAYNSAMETLHNLQGAGGSLLFRKDNFLLWSRIHGKTRADGSNIYKGIEDSLNRILFYDDQQNKTFELGPKELCECFGEGV